MLYTIIWLGALFGAIISGRHIFVGLNMYMREAINAKRESREIEVQYTDTLKHIGVAFLVCLILLGLFFGLSCLAVSGM